jgi:hypothetical protein
MARQSMPKLSGNPVHLTRKDDRERAMANVVELEVCPLCLGPIRQGEETVTVGENQIAHRRCYDKEMSPTKNQSYT